MAIMAYSACDEGGVAIGEEITLALAIRALLEYQPGPVVINSLTSMVINDIAESFNVECHRTRVGEANVATGMKELNAVAGGEGNGGIIYPELHLVRDGGVGMAIILNAMSATKKKISELGQELPEYMMIKVAYPLGELDATEIIQTIEGCYEYDQISRIDGLRVNWDDGWVQVRLSNTEPILRVYSEAKSEKRATEIIKEMLQNINRVSGEERTGLDSFTHDD